MKKFRLIPFRWLPGSWGLSGSLYEEQKARYYFDGYDLEEQLAYINLVGLELDERLLEIRLEYGELDQHGYEVERAKLLDSKVEREVALIEARLRAGEITQVEAEKAIATVREEPWIKVVNDGLDHSMGVDGYFFEFDWNGQWITALREAGYTGPTEESIVQAWFQEVSDRERSNALNGGTSWGH